MPGICDPGYRLIKAALDSGLDVEVLPGPSAIETALVSSGFAPDAFLFLGYMPRKKNDVRATLKNILMQTVTCIAFETPHRLPATLAIASEVLGDRHIAICRELTKKFAEIKRGPGTELLKSLPDSIKGEIVLVFAGGPPVEENDAAATDKAVHALQQLLAAGVSPRSAAETVSSLTGLPKNKSYDLALEIRKRG